MLRPFLTRANPVRDHEGRILRWFGTHTDIAALDRIQHALREAEERLRLALAASDVGTWDLDPATGTMKWDERSRLIFGFGNEAPANFTNLLTSVRMDDRARVATIVRAATGPGGSGEIELDYRRTGADGTERWVAIKGKVLAGEGTRTAVLVAGTAADVTDRKRVEETLRNTNAALREFADIIDPAAVLIRDINHRIIRWTSGAEALYGFTAAQALGVLSHDLFSTRFPEPMQRIREQLFATDRWEGELRQQGAHGKELVISSLWVLHRDRTGSPAAILEVSTDITERKRLEEQLLASQQTYRAIGESINYGIWICEPDGRNTYASESFLKLVGLTQPQCSEFGWGSVLHPDDAERTVARWRDCVRTRGNWDIEHRFRGVDGKYHWILARGVPVRDQSGEIICWAGINLDIDQVKLGEERLRRANRELLRANEDLSQFAFAASHDLQEPLRMITTYSQLLVSSYRGQLDDNASQFVGFISEGTRRMGALLTDLLAYTQLNAEGPIPPEQVDLDQVLRGVLESCRTAIEESGATIISDPLPSVPGHESHFVQLFQNLIGNAIKYRSEQPLG